MAQEVRGWLSLHLLFVNFLTEFVPNAYFQRKSNFTKGKKDQGFV